MSSNLKVHQRHKEGLLKIRKLDVPSRVSNSVGLGQGLRICISNKSPSDADGAGPGTTFENHHSNQMKQMAAKEVSYSLPTDRLCHAEAHSLNSTADEWSKHTTILQVGWKF